jgi:hypothetical protein
VGGIDIGISDIDKVDSQPLPQGDRVLEDDVIGIGDKTNPVITESFKPTRQERRKGSR